MLIFKFNTFILNIDAFNQGIIYDIFEKSTHEYKDCS